MSHLAKPNLISIDYSISVIEIIHFKYYLVEWA